MSREEELRMEADRLRAEANALLDRAVAIEDQLDGPRVTPVLCFWRHHSYFEEEACGETLKDAFGELDGMEDYGTASTVGVRVGGYLTTWQEWDGSMEWRRNEQVRADSDMRHRQIVLREFAEASA